MMHLLAVVDDPAQLFTVLKWIGASSGTTVALAGGWMLYTGRIVLGREFKEMCEQRDWWRDQSIRLMQNTNRAVTSSERAASAAEQTVSTALATPPPTPAKP